MWRSSLQRLSSSSQLESQQRPLSHTGGWGGGGHFNAGEVQRPPQSSNPACMHACTYAAARRWLEQRGDLLSSLGDSSGMAAGCWLLVAFPAQPGSMACIMQGETRACGRLQPGLLIRTGAVGSRRRSSSVCRFGGESKQTHRRVWLSPEGWRRCTDP